ncbi:MULTISPECIES: hypothetical protein [Kitasatospora]|uniref:Uncharacterized protein n=1 Tax=Kitasatospora setae (strain ATCC 33774 / DSM 43861 / JCM 3304 / KCC A-0304 / NBRC 14216 / KM-6054) TaxID=452652 RepID=E4N172_KITSK|nr:MULTISPECIES: hypothetical protein [Kitasatospora]BAJ31906.1 hypothetical protein KSE_61400 [Kitasatospora setae KM-6054]
MPSPSPSEEDFARALRAGAELAPLVPVDEFALGAERRGRRRVLRRRGGVASAVALVAAAVLVPTLLPDRASHDPVPAASPPRVDDAFMLDTLVSLLPQDGTVRDGRGRAPDPGDPGRLPQAYLEYTAGNGRKAQLLVFVDLVATPVGGDEQRLLCYEPITPGGATCEPATRPDGSRLLTSGYGGDGAGPRSLFVAYTRPDGRQVQVQEADGDRTGQELPLDRAKLTEIATAPQWQSVFGPLGTAPSRPPARPAPAADRMLAALTPLLGGLQPGTAHTSTDLPGRLRVDLTVDGRTSPLVLTVVPGWRRSYPADPELSFRAAHRSVNRLADGTLVSSTVLTESLDPFGGGTVADALLPDGTLVGVRLWGSGTAGQRAGDPVLTVDQLTAVVTSPTWSAL